MADLTGTTLAEGNRQFLALLKNPHVLQEMRATTGMPYWDRFVGLQRGDFCVLGGENGSGKSTVMLNLLLSAAKREQPVAVLSIEDVKTRLRARLLGMQAGVDPWRLMNPKELRGDDMGKVTKAVLSNVSLPFRFFEGTNRMPDVRKILEEQHAAGVRWIGLDYLQALRDPGSQDRRNEILNITQEIAHFCRDRQITVIATSQVVRPESRKVGTRPTRHWLKEASDIADAADAIVLVWRDQDGSNRPSRIVVDKDKDGTFIGMQWALQYDENKQLREVDANDE